jgi:hypothetical protein
VSNIRIPADQFPFMSHRTLAEVRRTELLLTWARSQPWSLPYPEGHELAGLLDKARRHNPPPEDERDGDAA